MSDLLRIRGGTLRPGEVNVSGFKHLAVPAIASTLLIPAECRLSNAPEVEDASILSSILETLGARVRRDGASLSIDGGAASGWQVPVELSSRIHGSVYLAPVLLGRFGRVELRESGGCRIGNGPGGRRPFHHMIEVIRRFSDTACFEPGMLSGRSGPFHATEIDTLEWSDDPSEPNGPLVSGVTKTAILAALAVQSGETVIHHPYWKPDVSCLLEFLKLTGAVLEASPEKILIGRAKRTDPVEFELVSDLGEVMTWLVCSAFLRTPIRITALKGPLRAGLAREIEALASMGVELDWEEDAVSARPVDLLRGIRLEVRSHGIYSDHHPLFTLLALRADGASAIREGVWTNRFGYVPELQCLGARLSVERATLHIEPSALRTPPRRLVASDLRAAAILLIAALGLREPIDVAGACQLKRGYPNFVSDLRRLGVEIERTQ